MDWIGLDWTGLDGMEISECLSATEYCGMEIIARSLPQLESRPKEVLMQHCCCCCSRCCYCCCTKFDLMFWMLCLIFLRDKVESCLQCDAKLWGATEESYLLTLKNWQSTLCPVAEECCRSNVIGCDWVGGLTVSTIGCITCSAKQNSADCQDSFGSRVNLLSRAAFCLWTGHSQHHEGEASAFIENTNQCF